MITSNVITEATRDDADLVRQSLAGDREAFGQIVARYQRLICSLAYSATGSLGQSEDLAQETFITAWKHLGHLRERDKLRAWLCGIARNRIGIFLRREGREPIREASPLEDVAENHSPEPLPVDHTISNEEAQILWRSLERIPEIYREPLVLFYREHQSIETVAANLDLTEDTVKQRLSRGRKMLQEQVLAFVEGALSRTNPGKTFTLGVLAALPLMTATAKAASLGTAIATGGATAKGAVTAGAVGGFLAVLGGAYVTFMALVDDSKSPRERQFVLNNFGKRMLMLPVWLAVLGLFGLKYFQTAWHAAWLIAAIGFAFAVNSAITLPRVTRRRQQIQVEDGTFDAADWTTPRAQTEARVDGQIAFLKTGKFLALAAGLFLFVALNEDWKGNFHHAVLMTAFMGLCVVRGFFRWRSQPKFLTLQNYSAIFPAMIAAMMLGFFDWHQYLAHLGNDVFPMERFSRLISS
jgi:RNA polymerase sigma factor (sigma-70 family)